MYEFRLIPEDELDSILPLLKILDDSIAHEILTERLEDMKQRNYECVGVYNNNTLVGISGIWTLNKYYVGKHIEPDNVMIHPDHRANGLGEQLMDWIHNYAKSKGCIASELNCYVSNHKGVRFWIKQGYKILGYHMQKKF